MICKPASNLINEQVGHEFSAFLQYVAVSSWCASETLPELSKYFAHQAEEEREHALKMIQFLNDTGQKVSIPGIAQPKCSFESIQNVISLAHEQEIGVTEQIKRIYDVAADHNDHLTQNFLHWFLEEQVEEVSSMDALLTIAKRAGDDLFRIEEYVARQGHPEDSATS